MLRKRPKRAELDDDPLAEDFTDLIKAGGFKPLVLDKTPKDTTVTLRVPASLITTAKRVAKKRGIKYQKMMRQAIMEFVARAA